MAVSDCTERQRENHYRSIPYLVSGCFRSQIHTAGYSIKKANDLYHLESGWMSYHRRYKLKDNRFGLLALTLREKAGLVQTEVARELGVSERTIGHWEGGTAFPTAANLKELIKLYL